MTPAHIQRIVQALWVVGTHVQHYRQGIGRADTTAGGIQRKLADRNAHAANALVAQAENTFAVGDDNHFDVLFGGVLQHVVNAIAVRVGDKQPARPAVNIGEVLAGFTHRWRVDDRHHFAQMGVQQAVEQGFVGVLNVAQVDVLIAVVFEILILAIGALSLFFNGFHRVGQQALQVEMVALFFGEGTAFIQQWEFQQDRAGIRDVERAFAFVFKFHDFCSSTYRITL
ncbi:Uncharacterised protein [Serratia quinivorans]|nr:Uncharacterised protein [Serratia quinivorans]